MFVTSKNVRILKIGEFFYNVSVSVRVHPPPPKKIKCQQILHNIYHIKMHEVERINK